MNYKLTENISWRDIQGQILILDPRINQQAHEMNPVGSFIWSSIESGLTHEQIINDLCQHFSKQLPEDEIKNDANEFIDQLLHLKLISHA